MVLELFVDEKNDEKTLKEIVKSELKISTRLLNKLKLNNCIFINDSLARVNAPVKIGDKIVLNLDYFEEDNIVPQKEKIEILYEDDWYLAVNKKANLCVHPSSFHKDCTLANYVKGYLNNHKKIRPVNRLDNGTSGVCLFAKNEYAQERFNYYKNDIRKEYIAICVGVFEQKKGQINAPISRKQESIIERCVDFENGQKAITNYEVIENAKIGEKDCSLVKFILETGRTHQIRVHSAYLNHPILGDTLYGEESSLISRQALHAKTLIFRHPITNNIIRIDAPFEQDFLSLFLTFNVDKMPTLYDNI